MPETAIDWTTFTRRIYINSPIQTIYEAWTTPAIITQWFLKQADYTTPDGTMRNVDSPIETGDLYEWHWYNWDGVSKGKIHEANGTDYLKFDFAGGTVEVFLEEERGMTHLKLVQSGIGEDDASKLNTYNGCSLGWSFWMINLKSWLEHGIKLNDTDVITGTNHDVVNC